MLTTPLRTARWASKSRAFTFLAREITPNTVLYQRSCTPTHNPLRTINHNHRAFSTTPSPGPVPEINTANFSTEVVQASMKVPVIIDCHADWCQPCKTLFPILHKEVSSYGTSMKLVKLDTDKNPQIAEALQVQKLPTVMAIFQGRAVDVFTGAIPAAEVAKWLQRLASRTGVAAAQPVQDTPESALETARKLLDEKDFVHASEAYHGILTVEEWKENTEIIAKAGLVLCCIGQGDVQQAREIAATMSSTDKFASDPLVVKAFATLEVLPTSTDSLAQLRARLDANPNDHSARLDLAKLLLAQGNNQSAVDEALLIVKADKTWNEGAAKIFLLKAFDVFGPTHPLTSFGRRRLSNYLFQ